MIETKNIGADFEEMAREALKAGVPADDLIEIVNKLTREDFT